MNPSARRLIYLWCAPIGCVVMAVEWWLLQAGSLVQRYSLPVLVLYLLLACVVLGFDLAGVVTVERATFWVLMAFWTLTMALQLVDSTGPAETWNELSLTVFMGLTILVVMSFLWFDTRPALINAFLAPAASTTVGLVYFLLDTDSRGDWMVDLLRYEVNLTILVVFVFALAKSKDQLLRTRVEAEQMRMMALKDPLTGLANRRQALAELQQLAERREPTGILLIDLDEFKVVNDDHGHLVGDAVLVAVAGILRSVDPLLAARWGGEEFLLIVDGDRRTAMSTAERVRRAVAGARLPEGVNTTVSIGVIEMSAAGSVPELLRLVDEQLYRAKRGGRDAVRAMGD